MSWQTFTEGLVTEGGKLVVLVFMLVFLCAMSAVLLITGHPPQEVGREALVGAFSSLLTLLIDHLRAKKQ